MKRITTPRVQINLQKSKQGQIKIGKQIRKFNKNQTNFFCLVQEPMNQSCKKYNHSKNRTAIYTDNTHAWYIKSLSTGDITVIQIKIKNRSTMVISCYLDIILKEVIPKELDKAVTDVKKQRASTHNRDGFKCP